PFPLLLLGLHRLARDAARVAAGVTIAALFLIVHAGHLESVLHTVCAAGLYFLFALWQAGPGRRWKPLRLSLLVGVLSLGLGAVVLLTFFEVWPQTLESAVRDYYTTLRKSVPLPGALAPPATFLVPHAFGL